MKISTIRATPVNIPFKAPYRFSYGSIASLTKTVIELETDEGIVGLGECADGDRSRDVIVMAERLKGLEVHEINRSRQLCVPGMSYTPWDNVVSKRRVFGGIEMAMWDAIGKAENKSLSSLLGGALTNRIPLTEYFSYRAPGREESGESTPVEVARYCAEMREIHGSTIFEGKVGTVNLNEEIRMVREVRAAIGDSELRLDANGTWTVPTARYALRRFSDFDITWFEEPCESYRELAELRSHTAIAFSAHSIDLPLAAELRCPDAIVTNVNEHGGIAATRDFVAACAAMGVGFRFHSGDTGIASAAYLHLTAAIPHVRVASQTLFHWYADDVIEGGPHKLENGFTPLPDGPGLGVTLDSAALKRCHQRFLNEGAFPPDPRASKGAGYGSFFRKS
ncbi:MAG: mandelate racemase/muconate lactonizing enzyme family protein [Pseudomonadota bacterium]